MANISFNARHGISVGTLPTQISDNVGNITAGTLTATGVLFGTTLVASADGAPSTNTSLRLRNSAANGQSVFALMPNGTNQITAFRLYNKDDVTGANTGALDIVLQGTSVIFAPWATGTGIAPTTLSIGLATSLSSASGLNISAGPLTVAGSISTSGNLHTNRHRLVFSGGPTDPNHTIYNNYSNLDGEGSWDGMKINAYLGLIVRQTDGSPAWMTVNSAGLIISGTTTTSGIFTNWDTFSGLEVRSAAGISRGFFGSESGSSNLRINAVGGITNIYSNSTLITAITPTGIAVTGSMSATGQVFNGYGNTAAIGYSWCAAATTTNSIEIVTGNTVLTTVSPTLSFHRYGSGGPQFRLDPAGSNVLYLESANAGSARGGTAPGGTYFSRLEITGNLTATGVVNVGTDLIVGGNLIVNGTTTTLNTATLDIEDINISLGKVVTPTDVTAVGGGITLLGTTNKTITWNNATAGWEFNQPVTVTGTISGTSIQSTPIGNVTPSTGAFTTLSASAGIYPAGTIQLASATIGLGGQTWIGGNSSATSWFINTPTGNSTTIGVNNVSIAAFSTTGLAVTGSITSTVPAAGAFTTLSATTGTFSSTLSASGLITSTGGISGGAASHTTGTFSGAITATTLNGLTPSASIIGSRLVATDVNGYIFGNYFNSTDAVTPSGVSGVMVKISTDGNYLHTGTAQSIATFLTGTTMDIVGNATSATSLVGTAPTCGYSTAGALISYGGAGGPQVMGNTANAAMLSFHRAGAYAVNFGLDTDNQLKVGGWSMGAGVSYPILHSGNYNSYSPTLSGGGASGTWGINVTGSALNITQYTINQSVGSGNSPTFSSLLFNAGNYNGIKFWSTDQYSISMASASDHFYGPVTDYSIKLNMGSGAGRGITFGQWGVAPIAAINTTSGNMQIAGTFTASNFSGSHSGTSSGANTGDQTNISGNAGTVTNAAFYRQFTVRDDRSDGNDYSLAGRSTGLYAITGVGTNGPGPTYLSLLHIANGGDVALQVAGGYNGDSLYFRGTAALQNGTQYTPWRTVIHSGNIGSQSVTYSTTAGSITSQANSATITAATAATGNTIALRDPSGHITSNYLFSTYVNSSDDVSVGTLTYLMGKFGDNYHRSATATKVAAFLTGSTMDIVGSSTSSPFYNVGTIAGGGGAATHFQFMGNISSAAGFSLHRAGAYAVNFGLDTDNQLKVGGWSMGNVSYPILHSGNYNSYAPTLSGGGASGTWGINVTGNAATVTIAANRTDAAWYQVLWGSGNSVYSPTHVTIYSGSATGAGYGAIGFNNSAWWIGAHSTYGLYSNTGFYAAGGLWDAGYRVYSGVNPQVNITGNAATATTANNVSGGILPKNSQVFTASGSFTVPAGITAVLVAGAGGAGGGGGGSYNTSTIHNLGGSGGMGGSSSFGSIVSFVGGGGGIGGASITWSTGTNGAGGGGSGVGGAGGYSLTAGIGGTGGSGNINNGVGGGNGLSGGYGGGGGGGGSGSVCSSIVSVTPGQVISVAVGAGGAGGAGASGCGAGGAGGGGGITIYW